MSGRAKPIGRRYFLKLLAGVPIYAALGSAKIAHTQTHRYGKLVDTTICIGCKRCMSACKRWNNLKVERDELVTDRETDLTANNWVVVNLLIDSKNRTARTYIHWACQHCIEPACAGVCPVKAITKLPEGPVVINEKKCIGCRYCFQACPFKVPRFDFKKRVTRKCHMCYNRVPLLNYMKPACVAACPVGALYFDYKHEVIKEAKRRLYQRGGVYYIMGLEEAGGTDMLTILPTQPLDLSLVVAPKKVLNHDLDKIRITASGIMGASALSGAMYAYASQTREKDKEQP
ncbi:MAG: 4Fe-4S dicluster domain-containing protein [Deltaproteobacteria bacterium]|nr:4Fe-4S dicluster domain-containing protein [Deltaproteobacteria bacterium]